MCDFVYILACQDIDGSHYVASCESCYAEIGSLAEVDGALLEIVAVACMSKDSEEYNMICLLHDVKPVSAIYRKVYKRSEEEQTEDA